jgi:hypothetical protein
MGGIVPPRNVPVTKIHVLLHYQNITRTSQLAYDFIPQAQIFSVPIKKLERRKENPMIRIEGIPIVAARLEAAQKAKTMKAHKRGFRATTPLNPMIRPVVRSTMKKSA